MKRESSKNNDSGADIVPTGRDLECGNVIIEECARFGQVRAAVMRGLKNKYGERVADRAMLWFDRRIHDGYLTDEDRVLQEKIALKAAKLLRSIDALVKDENDISQNSL